MRRGAAWVLIGKAGDQFLGFAFGVVLARLLAPEVFGLLLTIQVFTGLAGFISGGGMGQALVRARSVTKADLDIVFTMQLMAGCVIYTAFFLSAPLFAHWYDEPLYTDLLRVSALSFLFRPLINLPNNILFRQMRYKARAGVSLATLLASSAVSIVLAYLDYGVWSLVWGGMAGSIVHAALAANLASWRPGLSTEFRRGAELARYGFLVSANDIVYYIRSQLSIFILSQRLGPASVGLYNKGESLARMPFRFAAGSVYDVLFRALAAEQSNLDKGRYLFVRSITLVAVYASPLYVGLIWLAEPLVRGVYGPKWVEAAQPLLILSAAWPFWLLDNFSGAVAAAHDQLHKELPIQVTSVVVTALAIVATLPFGLSGVAWGITGSTAFISILMLRMALTTLQARWWDALVALIPAAALNIPLGLALWLANWAMPRALKEHDLLHVIALGGFGGIVYAALFLLMPLPTLAPEQHRWRKLLRLPSSSVPI